MVSLTTLLALAASALGAPAAQPQEPSPSPPEQVLPPGYGTPWAWHISGWEAGCARSGCSYNFNVSVPADQAQTHYGEYYCNGYENGPFGFDNYYIPCKSIGGPSLEAAARFRRRENGEFPKVIEVSVLVPGYEESIHPYNFTAYGDVTYNRNVAPDLEFDIYPTVWQQLPYPGASN